MSIANLIIFILMIVFIIGLILAAVVVYFLEKKDFNSGICTNCGEPLVKFDTDSQGGRGYCCEKCGYCVWISYNHDRNYSHENAKKNIFNKP